jgi:anti-anti-sigma regulatory factor/DNA-directed RNA polymerase subunit RPC12/RpoP
MLNIIKERVGDTLSIRLTGSVVGECVNLETLIGATPKNLRVNCKNLVRLNSNGVRAWIRFFDNVRDKGTQVILTEVSPAVVDKLNAFLNFACGATIESIYVPYHCGGCKRELIGLFSVTELKRSGLRMPGLKCPSCGMNAEFDDLADEYFRFIEREQGVPAAKTKQPPKKLPPAAHPSNFQEPSLMMQRPPQEEASRILRRIGT